MWAGFGRGGVSLPRLARAPVWAALGDTGNRCRVCPGAVAFRPGTGSRTLATVLRWPGTACLAVHQTPPRIASSTPPCPRAIGPAVRLRLSVKILVASHGSPKNFPRAPRAKKGEKGYGSGARSSKHLQETGATHVRQAAVFLPESTPLQMYIYNGTLVTVYQSESLQLGRCLTGRPARPPAVTV